MVKTETGFYFDAINAVNVCRYLYERELLRAEQKKSGIILKIDTEKYNEKSKDWIPEEYNSFKRHLWEKLDDFKYSKNNLNLLVRGITILGGFPDWYSFVEEFDNCDGANWASKNLYGRPNSLISPMDRRKLDMHIELYVGHLYCDVKFSGRLSDQEHKYVLYKQPPLCLREATASEIARLRDIKFNGGHKLDDESRYWIFKLNKFPFFVIENDLEDIVGCTCILPYNIDESFENNFDYNTTLKYEDYRRATSFFIHEFLFDNNAHRDLLINHLIDIIALYRHGETDFFLPLVHNDIKIFISTNLEFALILTNIGFDVINEKGGYYLMKGQLADIYKALYGRRYKS